MEGFFNTCIVRVFGNLLHYILFQNVFSLMTGYGTGVCIRNLRLYKTAPMVWSLPAAGAVFTENAGLMIIPDIP